MRNEAFYFKKPAVSWNKAAHSQLILTQQKQEADL
jgi:hypothetical protein